MQRVLKATLVGGKFSNVSPLRSAAMKAVRGQGNRTTELRLKMALVRARLGGWTVHPPQMIGRPDFWFKARQVAVFVDGCFWHGCSACGHIPRTNTEFWKAKLTATKVRDSLVNSTLPQTGVTVVRIWEHQVAKDLQNVVAALDLIVNQSSPVVGPCICLCPPTGCSNSW
jgi:DNA mismatch endonuclease, patch repair protein